jgi:hypothetical protein
MHPGAAAVVRRAGFTAAGGCVGGVGLESPAVRGMWAAQEQKGTTGTGNKKPNVGEREK